MAVVKIKSKAKTTGARKSAGAGVSRGATKPAIKKPTEPAPDEPSDVITEDDLLKLVPGGMAASFVKQKLHEKQLEVAGLAPPGDWDGKMPEVPNDISTTDHGALSDLLAQFTNVQSTALWHASTAYIEAGFYEEIAEYLENVALVNSDQSNDTKRKAEARTTEVVVAARTLHRSTYSDHVRFRDFARTCELRWRTVSRVGGFVGDDVEGGDATANKASTRGRTLGTARGKARGAVKRAPKK